MRKILIIEDDEGTAEMLAIIADYLQLDVISSAAVMPVADIRSLCPDLVLLDHWVAGELGGNLCFDLKNDVSTKDIPVIMLSANTNIEEISKESCADGYLAKPFNLDDLTILINKNIRQFDPNLIGQ